MEADGGAMFDKRKLVLIGGNASGRRQFGTRGGWGGGGGSCETLVRERTLILL